MKKSLFFRILRESLVLLFFLFAGFYVNRHIHIKGLYMDDLYMWSCYGEQSFWEFAFPFHSSTRFRPVYWVLTYLEMILVRNRPELFVPINILLNVGIAYFIYRFALYLTKKSRIPGIAAGFLYLISHFSYYQIAQALGLLETMSLFMAILILYLLLRYFREGRTGFFLASAFTYFLLVFSHERYLALLPLFYIALVFRWIRYRGRKNQRSKPSAVLFLLPLLELFVIILLRRIFIGTALPAGTGGTEVTDTFSLPQAIRFSVEQVLYIFGINIGPEYLSGIPWAEVSEQIRTLVYLSWLPLALVVFCFLLGTIQHKEIFRAEFWAENLLFLGFIALCIGCSSVTIRVEMRWVYVSFAGALLYLSYMIGKIGEYFEGRRAVLGILSLLFLLYAGLLSPVERYYRSYYPKIYFWENQDRMNSLAEKTIGRYGIEGVLGKQVYILGNSYEMSEFYGKTFFKVYDPEKSGQGTEIHFISELSELPAGATEENSILLREVPEERGYEEVRF